jgi:hypothetical protein
MIQDQNNNKAEKYWKQSSFSFKFYFLSSALIVLIAMIVPAIGEFFIDRPVYTIWYFQIWRLVLSMYGQIPGFISILTIVISFVWIYRMMKVLQLIM